MQKYCRDILSRLFELQITRVKADKMGQLQRLDPAADPEAFQRLNRELMMLEMERRSLRSDDLIPGCTRPAAVADFASSPVFARLIPASFLLSSIGRAFDC